MKIGAFLEIMKKIIYILAALLMASVAMNVWQCKGNKGELRDSVVTVVDTIRDTVPVAVDSVVVRTERIRVKRLEIRDYGLGIRDDRLETRGCDTLVVHDSVEVEIPITQKRYESERYKVWISGFHPVLDSIETYEATTTITRVQKRKRWGLGLQAGYGMGKNGLQPYVGVGVSWNVVSW